MAEIRRVINEYGFYDSSMPAFLLADDITDILDKAEVPQLCLVEDNIECPSCGWKFYNPSILEGKE